MKITHYCDPGHGWFKVSRAALKRMGLLEKISGYSYQRGDYVYLEEDCDAATYLSALDSLGVSYEIVTAHTDKSSRIRGYESFNMVAPLRLEYLPMISALTKILDKDVLNCRGAEAVKLAASNILTKFRYESQYSKKPDTALLKRYANWVRKVASIEEVAA